jgi:hypothetical protein
MKMIKRNCIIIGIVIIISLVAQNLHSEAVESVVERLISNFYVITGGNYQWGILSPGSKMFVNRKHRYTEVPQDLEGQLYLKTSNTDKYYEAVDPIYSFTLREDVTIYILYSDAYTQLEEVWLNDRNGWKEEEYIVKTSLSKKKSNRKVRSKAFKKGIDVELLGNGCILKNCDMYTVVMVPQDRSQPSK